MAISLPKNAYIAIEAALIGGNVVAIMAQKVNRAKNIARMKLLAGIGISNPLTDIASIPINVYSQEVYTYSAEITMNPVENGIKISDHVILNPLKLDLTFEISNWPDMDQKYCFELLTSMFKSRSKTDLLTEHKKLENMIMTNLQVTNSVPQWGKLACRASFQQIGFVDVQTTTNNIPKITETDGKGRQHVNHSAVSRYQAGDAGTSDVTTISQAVSPTIASIQKYIFNIQQAAFDALPGGVL